MSKIHILNNKGNNASNISPLLNRLVLETITQARINSWDNKVDEGELNSTVNTINSKISSINRDIESLSLFENATTEDINNLKTKLNDLSELVGLIRDESGSNDDYMSTLLRKIKEINDFIDNTYDSKIIEINRKIDNKADSYVQEDLPHPEYKGVSENNTYNGWLGDIWRKTSTGVDYKYIRKENNDGTYDYCWESQTGSIPDSLFDKIDGKSSIYFSKPTFYNKRDCWILESDEAHPPNKMGTMLFANVSNSSYNASDWVDLLTYITQGQHHELEDRINNFINTTYTNEIISINSKIDNKADSYVQENKPHEEYNNVSNNNTYNGWLGDIWRKTSTGVDYKYVKTANSNGTYNYIWETQSANIPDTLYDKIDGKASIYFAKPQTYNVHDCWILESDTVHSPQKKGTLLFANKSNTSYNASDWVDLVTYVTDADIDDKVSDVTTKYQELSDRFSWLVSSSSSASSLVITDKLIQAIATSNIQLSAKKILINGLLEGSGWRVDEEGNLEVNDLNIIGNLTCKSFSTENIVGSSIGQVLDSDKTYHVNGTNTITNVLDDLPFNLNGYTVRIYMDNNITEDITFRKHINGSIKLFMCGFTLYGFIHTMFDNSIYEFYGGNSESDTILGKIMPYKGYTLNSYTYSVLFSHSPDVILKNITIYADKINTNNVGVGATQKTNLIMTNVNFVGCKHNCRTYSLSKVHCDSSNGLATGVGWYAGTGSRITFGATTQAGGSTNTDTGNNGEILSSGVTFSTTSISGTNTSSSENNTIRSITYYPNYADTYRSSLYNTWKKDGVAKQGRWSVGSAESDNCNGYFFFGSQFSELKGYNITKIQITLTRKSGVGNSASCSHGIYYHTYGSRPSVTPSMTSCSKSISLAWNETGTATITDSTVLNGISNGTIKGFGIKSTYDSSHYSGISSCKVKIYFSENNESESITTASNKTGEAIVGETIIEDETISASNNNDFTVQATANYVPTTWSNGDLITSELLNKIEQGLYNCSTFCNEETINNYIAEQLNTLWESEY